MVCSKQITRVQIARLLEELAHIQAGSEIRLEWYQTAQIWDGENYTKYYEYEDIMNLLLGAEYIELSEHDILKIQVKVKETISHYLKNIFLRTYPSKQYYEAMTFVM